MSQDNLDKHLDNNFERRYAALKFMAISLTILFTTFYYFG